MRALVVDDSTAVRLYLRKILVPHGFEVAEARNGGEGLERVREQPVDLVLLDWNMPVMSGLELLQHIRSEPGVGSPCVMMVTSESDMQEVGAGARDRGQRIRDEALHPGDHSRQISAAWVPGRGMKPLRILIVDDSVTVRRLLRLALSDDPELEVAGVAANGRIALALLEQNPPDLVTLDIEMPEMDGLTALAQIRKRYPRLPVIMFSTMTQRGAVSTLDALSLGASDYVTKPTTASDPAHAIASIKGSS